MKKELRKCFVLGFVFITLFASLSHFLYRWTGENRIFGLFSPVNKSIWEHMKRIFFPMLLFTVIMSYFNNMQISYPSLVPALLAGLHIGTWLLPVTFYTYSGMLGFSVPFIDFFLLWFCIFWGLRAAYGNAKNSGLQKYEIPLKICTMIMLLLFMLFTYHPPRLGIFL